MLEVHDAKDLVALRGGDRGAASAETTQPSLIRVKSIIGYPSPNKPGTSKAHGAPLGEDEIRATKEAMGWDPDEQFFVPDGVYEHFDARRARRRAQAEWQARFDAGAAPTPTRAEEWDLAWAAAGRCRA